MSTIPPRTAINPSAAMPIQAATAPSSSRPKFVWFLVIVSGFIAALQPLLITVVYSGLIRIPAELHDAFKASTFFDHAASFIVAWITLAGSIALFRFNRAAPTLLLASWVLSIAETVWHIFSMPSLRLFENKASLFAYGIMHAVYVYSIYLAFRMRKQSLPIVSRRQRYTSQAAALPRVTAHQAPPAPEWLLNNISEASKTAGRSYTLFLGILTYCALTVVSTTDRQIIFDEPARLPLVDLGVPLVGFFAFSPILIFVQFVYLQMYLHRIKGLMSQLRNEYAPIENRRLYPWLITIAEDPEPGHIGTLQKAIVTASLWWLLPIVLFLYPIWFTKKHDPILSFIVGLVPLLGVWLVVWFWHIYEPENRKGRVTLAIVGSVLSALMLALIIPSSNAGLFTRGIANLNLSHQILITKPHDDYDSLYWADLEGAHLEAARLNSVVLSRANLKKSFLRFANLVSAKIDKADFTGAHLEFAGLQYADLEGALLSDAHLERANLSEARLKGAKLHGAHLRQSRLIDAHLEQVNFGGADMENADLRFAHTENAGFGRAMLKRANLGHANLAGAYLGEANLEDALLTCADAKKADFQNANLKGADLSHANLQGAKNLSVDQLSEVKSLFMAKLDATLQKELKNKFPALWKTLESRSNHAAPNCSSEPPYLCEICETP